MPAKINSFNLIQIYWPILVSDHTIFAWKHMIYDPWWKWAKLDIYLGGLRNPEYKRNPDNKRNPKIDDKRNPYQT